MKKPLVTILSPVYNGEKYLARFLDSVLAQDYPNIEFILVNDGSTDDTDNIVENYRKKLDDKLSTFKYIKQKNSWAAGAVNNGLKYVEGQYLTWPDSDDILTDDSISMKVEFLEKNQDYAYVRTNVMVYSEKNLSKPIYELKDSKQTEYLFEDLLFDHKNVYFCPGGYMARTSIVKKYTNMEIYIAPDGQNWQLLLPIAYKEKCGYINKVSYHYIERSNSVSHNLKSYKDYIKKVNGYEDIILHVLDKMDIENRKELLDRIKVKYAKIRRDYAVDFLEEEDYKKELNKLKSLNSNDILDKLAISLKTKKRIKRTISNTKKIIVLPLRIIRKIIKEIKWQI